jgi:hypothetical protein
MVSFVQLEEIIDSANNEDAKERQSYFCIPIPAQTKWGLDVSYFTQSNWLFKGYFFYIIYPHLGKGYRD